MHIDASSLTLGQSGASILNSAASAKSGSAPAAEGPSSSSKSNQVAGAEALKQALEARNLGQSGGASYAGPDPETEGGESLNVYA